MILRNIIFLFFVYYLPAFSQTTDCFDFKFSSLDVTFILDENLIVGSNELYFNRTCIIDSIDIDLHANFTVDSILMSNKRIEFSRMGNQISIPLTSSMDDLIIKIFYNGFPKLSKNPPWDGGIVFEKDNNGFYWVGIACQLSGASLWWPNKDKLYDEPDSMKMKFTVSDPYIVVSNGRLLNIETNNNLKSYTWFVTNSINNYNITFNIGLFSHFSDSLSGIKGVLDLDYYVLPDDLYNAKIHFNQVKPMISVFEKKFGPYPFYEDGYKIVQSPYLGMEHQSCISYGNQFKNGYLGTYPDDIDFDFIIIHESAHEWWGNSVSMKDRLDMWIHEAFATYSEVLYVEDIYGYDKMLVYLNYQRDKILNKKPIINNIYLDTDMYYKGSWMLHTLRSIINNDSLWYEILSGIQHEFKHQTVNTQDIIKYIERKSGFNLSSFFKQYLYTKHIPVFEYFFENINGNNYLKYRWNSAVANFSMPILVKISFNEYDWIQPENFWQEIKVDSINVNNFSINENLFLIEVNCVK